MSVELLVIIGIIFISILLAVVFLIPGEKKRKKKKGKVQERPIVDEKDWEQKVSRLEKHTYSLRDQILDLQKGEKETEKQLMIERVKVKKFQEKLSQERQWHEKEQGSIDKKGRDFQELKVELIDIQESYSKAHSANLRFEHQVKELQDQLDLLNERRRAIEEENTQLTAKIKNDQQKIAQLKKENIQLKKKKEDVNWIAQTEYQRVEKLLKEKEKELDRVTRENKK